MIEWTVILTPMLVLPIVMLFRFVGCAQIAGIGDGDPVEPVGTVEGPPLRSAPQTPPQLTADNKPPDYRKYILGEQPNPGQVKNNGVTPNGGDVTGYWRLVDPAANKVAEDQKKLHDGEFREGMRSPPLIPIPRSRPVPRGVILPNSLPVR